MQGRPSAIQAGIRSTLVSPAGSGGLRARLVRGTDGAAQPFVTVHDGRYARILLAELVGDDGVAQARFAWKLRVDTVTAEASGGRTPPSNAELDRVWQLERDELLRVHSPNVVAPVAVPSALTQSPPVFYCRRTDSYFHPVCPETRAPLKVCRDDELLRQAGLPAYAQDHVRYLHHGQAGGPQTFYRTGEVQHDTSTARIAGLSDLIRGWAEVAHGEQPSPELPCQTCEHRHECYPGGDGAVPAERELHAVSFYDVDSTAIELAATDFDTAVMRLGGGLPAARGTRAWMAGGDARGRTLEALRLKLAAFADICRGVRDVHDSGRPHLGISPANIVAFDTAGSSALPANWQMRFALTDLGGARPVRLPSPGGDEILWQPGREVSEDEVSRRFLSPTLRSLEGGSVTMSVACRSLPVPDGGEQLVVDVHRAGVPSFVLPGDLLLVQPVGGGVSVSARVDDVGAKGLQATVLELGEAAPAWGGSTFDAKLSFVRRSSPSADLYGLGVLLLRILLVHDEQSLFEVSDAVERCVNMMTNSAASDDGMPLGDLWQEILEGEQAEGRFASWNVMHRRADRQDVFDAELKGVAIVPKPIWQSLMGLAGKLLLASPIARGEGGASRPMKSVLAEVESLERQLHVELFDGAARDGMIARVCSQRIVSLRGELGETDVPLTTMPAPSPGAASPFAAAVEAGDGGAASGFVLAVGRVGELSIQQYHFSQERVTIGRREGENLLMLGDPMVSSKHAVIEWADGEYVLFDRGSTNGTEVDGIRLPVEVPHPLDDGSVIHIRPFMLSFHRADSEATQSVAVPMLSVQEVYEELRSAYAEFAHRGEQEVFAALTASLDGARASLGRKGLLQSLEAILDMVMPGGAIDAPASAPSAPSEDPLAAAALRAVRQLARTLTEAPELESEAEVQEFAGRVQRFVEVTTRWIEELLDWRRLFGKQLQLRATQTGAARTPLRSAGEVRAELLRPTGEADGAAASDYFLSRFFDDVMAILEDLVEGNQRVRRAIREQLDPERLVGEAGREAKLSLLVKTAAGSGLWKLYEETFANATAGSEHDDAVQRLLAAARERRADRS